MAHAAPEDIRNVAFVGHGATGKTTLVETLLHEAGAIPRVGSVTEGTSILDHDDEEKEREHSVVAKASHAGWKGTTLNLVDTPGYPDFIGEVVAGSWAVDACVLCVDASAGVKVNTRKVWSIAEEMDLPVIFAVTRLDLDQARWDESLAAIRDSFGERALPLFLPDGSGGDFSALTSVLDDDELDEYEPLMEAIIEADEELLMRYLEGESLEHDEIAGGMTKALTDRSFFPIIPVSAEAGIGVTELGDALVDFVPDPLARSVAATDEDDEEHVPAPDGPLVAGIFKTVHDPYVGRLSVFRIFGGELSVGDSIQCPRTGESVRASNIFKLQGGEQDTVDSVGTGDIAAVAKFEDAEVGDTLSDDSVALTLPGPEFPKPMVAYAIEPVTSGDEQKMAAGLRKIAATDPSFEYEYMQDTREMIARGMSTLHLDIVFSRLLEDQGVEVEKRQPKTPYRETISGKGSARYRHKKQSGGAGEFGEVELRVAPMPRGEGFEYVDEVTGGAIPTQFIPSVEKGIESVLERGHLAGYPIVDLQATVYDGKTHPVDGKDSAFQKAGREAFKQAFDKAKPVLLEPIVDMEVTVPTDFMGDIMSDLTGRRGQIQGTDAEGDFTTIRAKIPQAEIGTYSTELRSLTGGEGSYETEFSHYDVVPSHMAQDVIEASKKADSEG